MRRAVCLIALLAGLGAAAPAAAQLPSAPAPEGEAPSAPGARTTPAAPAAPATPSEPGDPGTTGSVVEQAAQGLRTSPVYVHPDAEERISDAQADRLRARIANESAGPLYIAIVPRRIVAESGGSVEQALVQIAERIRVTGVYVIVAGDELRAAASRRAGFERGAVPRMADDALEVHRGAGVYATLADFVDRVGQARASDGEAPSDRDPGAGGFGGLGLLALVLGGFGLYSLAKRRRRRREERAQVEELRENARDDLVALGDDVRALDLDVQMPAVDPRAQQELGTALARYEHADRALASARHPDDFAEIGEALEQGRYALAAARARVEGREPPEHRPPCFFDPRHGPSTRDVEWGPDGYAPRPVPVCEADAVRLEQGQAPMTREVMAGGQLMPLYNAPAYFSPYAGGFFGGFTGFLPGMLFGSMLGGMFSPGIGSAFGGAGFGGGFGDGDLGGDFGGGDWGGLGDFGGGDFGGGDFGGGDF